MIETQTAEKDVGEAERPPDPEPIRGRWQEAIEHEMEAADSDRTARPWTDRNIAVTTWSLCDQEEGAKRGHIELALSEDGAQVIIIICRHEMNTLESDVEMGIDVILSVPEAEALAMALLARRPGKLSSDYANGFAAQGLEVPTPVV